MEQGLEIFDFHHFRFGKVAGATVAICKDPSKLKRLNQSLVTPNTVIGAVSWCSPDEQSFSRRKGRQRAAQRLSNCNEDCVLINKGRKFEMVREVLLTTIEDGYVPPWWDINWQIAAVAALSKEKVEDTSGLLH